MGTTPKAPLKKMKKFRFVLLHEWVVGNYSPCRVCDVGGGKGLLSYLLMKDGFTTTVIDPQYQELPEKYKDLQKKKMIINLDEKVTRITANFETEMAKNFDLLIGLHAHGSNLRIIDAAAKYHNKFILLPCCIINEGIDPYSVTDWLAYIEDYANSKGIKTKRIKLNFKGQRTAIYSI